MPAWSAGPILAAIDLDGTLLGPDRRISPANAEAVAALQRAGAEVVLASGRHFHAMLPYARTLPGIRWMVSSQGGEVGDVGRGTILDQRYLDERSVHAAIAIGSETGLAVMGYTASTILACGGDHATMVFHAGLPAGMEPVMCTAAKMSRERLHKVMYVAAPDRIDAIMRSTAVRALGLQTVRTDPKQYELLPVGVTKASGLELLARHLGLHAGSAVAFGDSDNDLPMFAWAGVSVAMPHGHANVREKATWTAPEGSPEEAVARAVKCLLAA